MIELTGNLWEWPADAHVITTNGSVTGAGRAVMGRGCAKEAAVMWPELQHELGALLTAYGNRVHLMTGYYKRLDGRVYRLVTFPVKHHWQDAADPQLIVKSLYQLTELATWNCWENVVMPRPGCGNGRLSWADVRTLLQAVLNDRFLVTTYEKEQIHA